MAKDPISRPSLLGGSKVLSGFGRMLVTAVGPNSQSGAIAEMVADGKESAAADGLREETLLQQKLAAYATFIGQFGLGAASLATIAMTARFRSDHVVIPNAHCDLYAQRHQFMRSSFKYDLALRSVQCRHVSAAAPALGLGVPPRLLAILYHRRHNSGALRV